MSANTSTVILKNRAKRRLGEQYTTTADYYNYVGVRSNSHSEVVVCLNGDLTLYSMSYLSLKVVDRSSARGY